MLGAVVHTVEQTVDCTAETRCGQTYAAQLRQVELAVVAAVENLEGIRMGVVVNQLYATHAEGVVDIGNILFDVVGAML